MPVPRLKLNKVSSAELHCEPAPEKLKKSENLQILLMWAALDAIGIQNQQEQKSVSGNSYAGSVQNHKQKRTSKDYSDNDLNWE